MKATGIVRKVDNLGRVVIPVELRRSLGIEGKDGSEPGDPLEIYVDGDKIIFKKYEPACIFCGSVDETIEFKNKTICSECLAEMRKSA